MKLYLSHDLKDAVVNAMQLLIVSAAALLACLYERLDGGSYTQEEY